MPVRGCRRAIPNTRRRWSLPSACSGPPQFVEVVHAAFAQRIQPARDVGAGRQAALHVFADAQVLELDLVAEGAIGVAPGAGFARVVERIVEVELDPAA